MNIQVKDKIGLSDVDVLALVQSLLRNRPPKDGGYDYGFETHGAIGVSIGDTGVPIQVYQQKSYNHSYRKAYKGILTNKSKRDEKDGNTRNSNEIDRQYKSERRN